jgi:hypothetical protein
MKNLFEKIFSPLLSKLDSGKGEYNYQRSHRLILVIVGSLFSFLTAGILAVGINSDGWGFLFPSIIFGGVGFSCIVIACLGSDRAVARIWSSGK